MQFSPSYLSSQPSCTPRLPMGIASLCLSLTCSVFWTENLFTPVAGNMACIVTMCNNRRNACSRRAFVFPARLFSNCRPKYGLKVAVFHMTRSRLMLEFKCVSCLSFHTHWSCCYNGCLWPFLCIAHSESFLFVLLLVLIMRASTICLLMAIVTFHNPQLQNISLLYQSYLQRPR
jgi:hypothetical protein